MRSLSLASAWPLLVLLLAAAAAPCFVAADEYDGRLLRPFGIDAEANQDALLSFPAFGVPTYSPRLSLSVENSECCDCVHTVSRHLIGSALESVAKQCEKVSCPVLKKRCDWIDAHKEEYTGALVVEIRPITDGYMYCYGNGTCDHPGVPKSDVSAALFVQDSSAEPQLLLSQLAAAAPFVAQAMRTRVAKVQTNYTVALGEERSDREKRSCHSCLRHGVKYVLKQSLRHLEAACAESKCPQFQKFCSWAAEHKQFVRGMVYAHVQPYKAAGGYCAGTGSCGCGGDAKGSPRAAPFSMGEKEQQDEEQKKRGHKAHGSKLAEAIGSIKSAIAERRWRK